MKLIINTSKIIKQLQAHNLIIDDKQRFENVLFNCNYNTVIQGYSDIFYFDKSKKLYEKGASSNQIIEFYNFDINLGNHILRYILQIEKKLNTNIAYVLINTYHIPEKCLFKLPAELIRKIIFPNYKIANPMLTYDVFMKHLTKYLDTNEYTKKYHIKNASSYDQKWIKVPLDLMCLTWSFSTTLNVFLSLNEEVIRYIVDDFGVPNGNVSGFIDFMKNILYLRNLISHNYVIYNAKMKFQSASLNKLYMDMFHEHIDRVDLREIALMVGKFVQLPNFVNRTFLEFNKLNIKAKFKQRVKLFEYKTNHDKKRNLS